MQHVCLSQVHWFFSHLLLETTFCDFNLISWISFQLSHITQHLFKGQTTLDMGHHFLSDKKHNNVMGFILILFYLHSCMYISIPFLPALAHWELMLNFSKLLHGVTFKDTFLGHIGCVVSPYKSHFFSLFLTLLKLTCLKDLSLLDNPDNSVNALFSLSFCYIYSV